MKRDYLYLGGWAFPVIKEEATLHALISNATDFKLYWMINIRCSEAEVQLDGETFHRSPRLYHESMELSVHDWKDITGKMHAPGDDKSDPPAVYLFSHEDLENYELQFGARQGNAFDVDWQFSSADYQGRVQTTVSLTEVTVWLREVSDIPMAKALDLNLSGFSEPELVQFSGSPPQFKFRPI